MPLGAWGVCSPKQPSCKLTQSNRQDTFLCLPSKWELPAADDSRIRPASTCSSLPTATVQAMGGSAPLSSLPLCRRQEVSSLLTATVQATGGLLSPHCHCAGEGRICSSLLTTTVQVTGGSGLTSACSSLLTASPPLIPPPQSVTP